MAPHPARTMDPIPQPMAQARFDNPGCISSSGRRGRSKTRPLRLNSSIPVSRRSRLLLANFRIALYVQMPGDDDQRTVGRLAGLPPKKNATFLNERVDASVTISVIVRVIQGKNPF